MLITFFFELQFQWQTYHFQEEKQIFINIKWNDQKLISIKSYIHLKTWLPNSLLPNTQASLTICSILLHIPALGLTSVICITTVTQVSLYYISQAMNLALWRIKPRFWRLLIAASNLCIKAFVQKYLKWCLMNPVISATCRHHSQPASAALCLVFCPMRLLISRQLIAATNLC